MSEILEDGRVGGGKDGGSSIRVAGGNHSGEAAGGGYNAPTSPGSALPGGGEAAGMIAPRALGPGVWGTVSSPNLPRMVSPPATHIEDPPSFLPPPPPLHRPVFRTFPEP